MLHRSFAIDGKFEFYLWVALKLPTDYLCWQENFMFFDCLFDGEWFIIILPFYISDLES